MQTALNENDRAALQQLFSPEVRMLESPFASPIFGSARIQQHYDAFLGIYANLSYQLIGVQGEVGYAQLEGTWGSAESVVYSAVLALRFNAAGLCTEILVWGGPTISRAIMMKNISGVFSRNLAKS
ncbi:hypothetical protein [Rufibacter tibetensis]|uniref:SnoaL-like domain-containing protein n=1 Tax=Rufibacter tibetensis TaxID=512763 RepID=A0A0P0CVQ4_9BACT|nr:hypothetical protein [Rufibacter tibetensis]ALI98445.1 hypothetical protein DC20_04935 [Rufibacter tibetensis]